MGLLANEMLFIILGFLFDTHADGALRDGAQYVVQMLSEQDITQRI